MSSTPTRHGLLILDTISYHLPPPFSLLCLFFRFLLVCKSLKGPWKLTILRMASVTSALPFFFKTILRIINRVICYLNYSFFVFFFTYSSLHWVNSMVIGMMSVLFITFFSIHSTWHTVNTRLTLDEWMYEFFISTFIQTIGTQMLFNGFLFI